MLTLMSKGTAVDSASMGVVTRLRGDVRATFDRIDESHDGAPASPLRGRRSPFDEHLLPAFSQEPWHSIATTSMPRRRVPARVASAGYIDKAEISHLLQSLGMQQVQESQIQDTLAQIEKVAKNWDGTRPDQVSFVEFADWYVQSEA
eukprot:SAG11_NODE_9989_length_864_cov_1.003922_2_plen_146_part_01